MCSDINKRLEVVLKDDELRSKFKEYLGRIKAEEQLIVLDVWTECNELVTQNYGKELVPDETKDILKKAVNIKNKVMEQEILHEKNAILESVFETNDVHKIQNVIEQLLGTLREELIDYFEYYLDNCARCSGK